MGWCSCDARNVSKESLALLGFIKMLKERKNHDNCYRLDRVSPAKVCLGLRDRATRTAWPSQGPLTCPGTTLLYFVCICVFYVLVLQHLIINNIYYVYIQYDIRN